MFTIYLMRIFLSTINIAIFNILANTAREPITKYKPHINSVVAGGLRYKDTIAAKNVVAYGPGKK